MNPFLFLLDVTTKVAPSAGGATQAAAKVAGGGSITQRMMQNPIGVVVVYCLVLFVAMYFLSIRPTRKKEQKLADMRNAVEIGDSVLLSNGLFGKIVDITAECYIIEFGTNKSVRIPVLKQEVFGKREPNLSNKEEVVVEEAPKKSSFFGKKDVSEDESKEETK